MKPFQYFLFLEVVIFYEILSDLRDSFCLFSETIEYMSLLQK